MVYLFFFQRAMSRWVKPHLFNDFIPIFDALNPSVCWWNHNVVLLLPCFFCLLSYHCWQELPHLPWLQSTSWWLNLYFSSICGWLSIYLSIHLSIYLYIYVFIYDICNVYTVILYIPWFVGWIPLHSIQSTYTQSLIPDCIVSIQWNPNDFWLNHNYIPFNPKMPWR